MLQRRLVWWAGLLVVLLLAASAPAVLAQGGTGDKTVFGGNYTLPSGQSLNGGLIVLGGNASLEPNSMVTGDVRQMGGNLRVAGRVRGDITVFGGTLNLAGTAVVDGKLNSIGGSIQRAPGAMVGGSSQGGSGVPVPDRPLAGPQAPRVFAAQQGVRGPLQAFLSLVLRLLTATGLAILLALIGAVVLLLAPRYTAQVATTVAAQPALNFATGLLTLVLAFLVGIPLLIACGLGLLVWLAAILTLIFGWIAVGLWVGRRLLAGLRMHSVSSVAEVALGVFLITWLAWVLPCIGWLFGLVLGSIGVGAVLLTRFGTQPSSGLSGLAWGGPSTGPGSAPRSAVPFTESSTSGATYPPVEPPASSGSSEDIAAGLRSRSLEDLEAVNGITPEIADSLRASGSTTLVALATSDPATLAGQSGVSAERVRDEDWIGQARRLLG